MVRDVGVRSAARKRGPSKWPIAHFKLKQSVELLCVILKSRV